MSKVIALISLSLGACMMCLVGSIQAGAFESSIPTVQKVDIPVIAPAASVSVDHQEVLIGSWEAPKVVVSRVRKAPQKVLDREVVKVISGYNPFSHGHSVRAFGGESVNNPNPVFRQGDRSSHTFKVALGH